MHIGFDISQIGASKAGCGYFADSMIKALLDEPTDTRYSLYNSFGDFYFDPGMPVLDDARGAAVTYGPRHATRAAAAAFWNAATLDEVLGHPDIVHANNFWCPTALRKTRLVYTLYDLSFMIQPSWTTESNRIGCCDGVIRAAAFADYIVAISESSKQQFLALFPQFPSDRIAVVYPCARFSGALPPGRPPAAASNLQPREFWLSVGTIEPRKNQLCLAEAYAAYLEAGGKPLPLVFAGGKGWLMDGFQEKLIKLGIAEQVVFTGYVKDEELVWLYNNCYANIYPSLFEGFGLPVLEGMQIGAPTICSRSTSLPEVAGDAALMVDPHDVAGWTAAMLEMQRDVNLREALAKSARLRAGLFDWSKSAGVLRKAYETVASMPKLRG